MEMIFMACTCCDEYIPYEKTCLNSIHTNCVQLRFSKRPCIVERILLGKIGPTRSSGPEMYGIDGIKTNKNIVQRCHWTKDGYIAALGDGEIVEIGSKEMLPDKYVGLTIEEALRAN